jgi:glutamate-1-semialdehyde 2,1-aminomutase
LTVTIITWVLGLGALLLLIPRLLLRLQLSRAKHRSLAGHAKMSRRLARLIPFYEYDDSQFFEVDGAPREVSEQRRVAFQRLTVLYADRFAKTVQQTREVQDEISDLQFTARYRVPFQFSRLVRQHLNAGSFVVSSSGPTTTDLDGNQRYDLTGSYGVNVFGYDFYKECIERGSARVRDLGPVLGAYHPVTAGNVHRLREISGMDEVSFHMSGTEAVMQAVRLARYHTKRRYLVRFCGAYHGWWGEVQPGVGNPVTERDTLTLNDMSDRSLSVLRRRQDIACVLVNPLQALHPNASAPSDSTLVDRAPRTSFDRTAYTAWLKRLRQVCSERGIVLIFDEVFLGFRLARGGAQEYFGVQSDMVTYGKTVAGGLPIGVVCGRAALMKRFREDRPADVCFARGTFNSNPYVMGAMAEFLERLDSPEILDCYRNLDELWNSRATRLNERLSAAGLQVRVSNLSSVWTVGYLQPSRYHWMFQYYLRAEDLALSWVGTGRLIFSLDYSEDAFAAVADRFMAAARQMQEDGWWWQGDTLTSKAIKRRVLLEMFRARRVHRASDRSTGPEAGKAAIGSKA